MVERFIVMSSWNKKNIIWKKIGNIKEDFRIYIYGWKPFDRVIYDSYSTRPTGIW